MILSISVFAQNRFSYDTLGYNVILNLKDNQLSHYEEILKFKLYKIIKSIILERL